MLSYQNVQLNFLKTVYSKVIEVERILLAYIKNLIQGGFSNIVLPIVNAYTLLAIIYISVDMSFDKTVIGMSSST